MRAWSTASHRLGDPLSPASLRSRATDNNRSSRPQPLSSCPVRAENRHDDVSTSVLPSDMSSFLPPFSCDAPEITGAALSAPGQSDRFPAAPSRSLRGILPNPIRRQDCVQNQSTKPAISQEDIVREHLFCGLTLPWYTNSLRAKWSLHTIMST